MKKLVAKWKGGAEKHGGILGAVNHQVDRWARDTDEVLGCLILSTFDGMLTFLVRVHLFSHGSTLTLIT